MRKRLLFTLFAILFCSTMFGQNFTPKYEYQPDGTYTEPMTLLAKISFDGAVQNNANLELGVFSNDELRGGCFLMDVFGTGDYLAMPSVFGERGQYFTFKVYDHTPGVETEREWNVSCTFINGDEGMEYMSYNAEGFVDPINPAVINFVTPNHWTPSHTDYQFNFNVIAVVMKDGVEQTDTNLELGAFDANGKVRGSVKLQPQTLLGNTRYYADMLVYGTKGDEITFKLYDHGTGQEFPFNEVNSCVLTEDKDASGNPILGSYLKPLEVNFITAPYVAQIGENKYLSFDAALEAAEDGDEITLLEDVTLAVNPTVVSKDININLDGNTVTGTIELAHTGATVTGVAEAMTVTSGVEGYIVVCENNVYSLSERQPSGKVAYRAYINDSESREAVQVDLTNVYAKTSFVVELLDANDNVLTTTSLKAGKVNAESYTCNIVLWGTASGSWDTEIKASKLTVANIPATINVYADGTLVDTYANALGAGTNVDETEKYKALDCVYKEAKIGETLYATFAAAYEEAATGNEIILLADVDFAETTVSKDININLNNNTVTGTIILANTGATVTCTEGAVNVTTSLAGYEVVYESGVYKLVRRQASAEVAYRAYVHDKDSYEGVAVDLVNVYAEQSLKVELYSGEQLLTSTTYAMDNYPIDADEFTCLIVLDGTADEYWNTTIECSELTVANIPTTIKVYADNNADDNWVHTYNNALGAGTNVDETEKYKALDCVYDYEVAKVGDKVYWNINNAIANWTAGSTLTLLEDVTLSDVITLKSTEHHILNLDTYTMTAAEGKNAIEIKSYGFENRNERAALTIMADETNPDEIGTIDAGAKSCIYYKYDATLAGDKYDRPIIYIKGGVYEGSSYSGISSTGHSTAQDKCATFNISGGTFNCGLNLTKTKLLTSGGLFNESVSCTGGSTSIRLISGGTFKSWGLMTADASSKFAVGTAIDNYNVGVYVDDNGYLVVGGDVITEAGGTFEASSANYSGWSTYLQYSSAATNGLYYTSAIECLKDNDKTSGSVNIYTDELDLTNLNYKGTLVITKSLTVTFPEGTTPAWKVASGVDDHQVGYTESVENGVVTRVYTLFTPVAQVGETYYATLQEAIDATTSENTTVKVLKDITLEQTATIAEGKTVVLDLNGKTINAGWEDQSAGKHIYAFTNNGTLTINNSSTEANGTINTRGIFNYGAMTLTSGTINAIDGNGGYGVRNYDGATFTMNGGTIATTLEDDNKVDEGGYDASPVRVDEGATFTMYGGVINNICDFTVAIDNYGTTIINDGEATTVHTTLANSGTMTINGGSFTCNGLEGITAHALWAAAGKTTINGGTFDGKDNYNGFNVDAEEGAVVEIKGGTFLSCHSGSLYGKGTIAVSGGKFFDPVPEGRCAEGYIPTTNADGTYGVKPGSYVAKVGDVKYETLEAALAAAQEGCTIDLLADVEVSSTLSFSSNSAFDKINVTFNGNGKTIKAVGTAWNDNTWLADIAWNVTLNNVTFDGNNTGCKGVQFYTSESTLNNITVKNISADKWGTDYAIHANASELTVIGSLTFENCKHGMLMVDLGNNTGKEASVVSIDNNATVNGVKVILNHKDASLEAPASAANYVSMGNVPGYTMVYENGVYILVAIEVQTITLEERWNWVSHYVVGNTDSDILTQLKNGLGAYGVQIKNQNDFTDYGTDSQGNTGWFGTLYTTSVKEMYKVNTSLAIDQTLQVELSGVLVDPAQHPITLVENWNYIGYPLNEGVSVGTVFANVAKDGDYVKSQDAFAEYYGGTWHGNLKTMTPGEGYMYRNISLENVDVTKTLVYSYPNAKEATEANITSENNYWVPASSQYAGNMTMVAMIDVKGGDYEVAAFVGGEVRGSSRPVYIESLDAYMFFLTIHGDEVAEMTFKVYDLATGEEYSIDNRMNYSDDAVVGSVRNPYMLTCSTLAAGENNISNISIYPNPTTTGNEINLGTECDTVEVFNALGVKVAEYQNVDTVDALETAGIYVIRITNDGNVQNCRLIVK